MTTLDLIDLLFSFAFGATVSTVVCLWVHRQHKESWQAEFRRLMAGIESATICLNKPTEKGYRLRAIKILQNTYNGE